MSEPAGPFKVVLQSVDDTWNSRVRSEVSRLFQIDDETASNIVSAIPIVVLDGLDARTAGIVRERMRPLVSGGCRVVTTDDPMDTIPRVNWPEMPEVARVPADEARTVVVTAGDAGPPLAAFACPGCGTAFHLHAASPARTAGPPASAAQGGALATPGASAPRTGGPGTDGTRVAEATHAGVNGTPRTQLDPGPKLAGDDWLDPPIPSKPASAPAATAPPPPAPAPVVDKPPVEKPPEPRRPSLIDDPLLVATSLDAPAGMGAPTTLSAKPITNRFARNAPREPGKTPAFAATQAPALATPATKPAAASAPVAAAVAPPPPPPPVSPPRPTDRFPRSAPPPPVAPVPSSSALDDELDVHFDEASDMDAAAKLPKRSPDDLGEPSGVGDEVSLLDDDLDAPPPPKTAAKGKPPAPVSDEDFVVDDSDEVPAKPAAKKGKVDLGLSDDDDLLFDKDDKPAKSRSSRSEDGSFGAESIDDLLDGPPPATISKGAPAKPKGRDPKPLPASDDQHEALFTSDDELDDDAPPPPRKSAPPPPVAPKRDPFASTGHEDDEEALFGESNDPDAEPKNKKKGPRESRFEDALNMFEEDDERPLDDGKGLEPLEDEVPDIQPLDLASDVAGKPSASSKGGGKAPAKAAKSDPFAGKGSSAILEPLDPNEAMAILKTHQKDGGDRDDDDLDLDDDPPPRPSKGKRGGDDEPGGPSGDLEPLDPNEALAILGTDEPRGSGKTPPRKPGKQKNGRRSEAAKLVPLSASDEDLAFLDDNKGKSKKNTDPFARAKKDPGASSSEIPASKKRTEASPARSSKGGGGAAAASPAASSKGARPGGRVPEGVGDCGLVLPRISTESKRQKAAELISEIRGMGVDEALKLTERTIIPVLTGVTRDVAEFHKEKFERAKISARVTTRQKDR